MGEKAISGSDYHMTEFDGGITPAAFANLNKKESYSYWTRKVSIHFPRRNIMQFTSGSVPNNAVPKSLSIPRQMLALVDPNERIAWEQ